MLTVIQRFDGHIAQYLGDGLLVYFGYPQAHEDDAQRAVHAGLACWRRWALNAGWRRSTMSNWPSAWASIPVWWSWGRWAVGAGMNAWPWETRQIAARLQGLAEPDTVVISADTWRLIEGYVQYTGLGPQTLKGVTAPSPVYRVLSERGPESLRRDSDPRLDAAGGAGGGNGAAARALGTGAGRSRAGGAAQRRSRHWQVATGAGAARAHRGASRMPAWSGAVRLITAECSASGHAHLHRLLRWGPDDAPAEKLGTLEATLAAYWLSLPEVVPLFAALLSLPLPERYPPLTFTPQRHEQKTLDAMLAWLLAETDTAAGAVRRRRPALDRSLDARVPHPLPRPGANGAPPDAADLPSGVSPPWSSAPT